MRRDPHPVARDGDRARCPSFPKQSEKAASRWGRGRKHQKAKSICKNLLMAKGLCVFDFDLFRTNPLAKMLCFCLYRCIQLISGGLASSTVHIASMWTKAGNSSWSWFIVVQSTIRPVELCELLMWWSWFWNPCKEHIAPPTQSLDWRGAPIQQGLTWRSKHKMCQ